MPEKQLPTRSLDELPKVHQELRLICRKCHHAANYDVGIIYFDAAAEGDVLEDKVTFTHYFRCLNCAGPGPFDLENRFEVLKQIVKGGIVRSEKVVMGRCQMFDGTCLQTVAMGEEYLLNLAQAEPASAFLQTRLGNLLLAAGLSESAAEHYEKAVALDPGDVEARHQLFESSLDQGDLRRAQAEVAPLIRSLLEGRTGQSEETTHDLAWEAVRLIREAPPEFQSPFLDASAEVGSPKEDIFIRSALERRGDPEKILQEAADCLLAGELLPLGEISEKDWGMEAWEALSLDPVPSLIAAVKKAGIEVKSISIGMETNGRDIRVRDRQQVSLTDGVAQTFWHVPSLRELFRGDRPAPADLDHYPPEYAPYFFAIEKILLSACEIIGDRTDQEMEEIYSNLRRRPDGRSQGPVHDLIWQAAALLLGSHIISAQEFEGIFGQLARSTRTFAVKPVSRNYLAYLRSQFGRLK